MPRNVELKARLSDPQAVLSRIQSLGATGPEQLAQTDTFFDVPVGRLKLREFRDGTGELIFYERTNTTGPKVSDYIRVPALEPTMLRHVLARSLGVRATVVKRRSVFLVGQTRIHLDDVSGLGSFMEFEVVLRDGQSIAEGEQIAASLMDVLGVAPAALVACAYVDLFTGTGADAAL